MLALGFPKAGIFAIDQVEAIEVLHYLPLSKPNLLPRPSLSSLLPLLAFLLLRSLLLLFFVDSACLESAQALHQQVMMAVSSLLKVGDLD